jgi:hypothetical protein
MLLALNWGRETEDGDSRFLQNVDTYLPDYIASNSGRL